MRRLTTALVAVVSCVGCPAHVVETPTPPTPPSLDGAWQTACFVIKNADDTDGSARLTWGFTDTLWALDSDLFADLECQSRTGSVHSDGGYALRAPSTTVADAWDVSMDVRSRSITPRVEGFIYFLQAMSCAEDFGVDRATDVLDDACPALGIVPLSACQVSYDLVAVDDSGLRLGAKSVASLSCTPAERPTALGAPLTRMQ